MKIVWILLLISGYSNIAHSQQDSISSVNLRESNVIYITKSEVGLSTVKLAVDSLVHGGVQDLASALSELPSVWVKSYGISGASSPVFRGSSAAHTQVFWNGINLNSVTLGQADLRAVRFSHGQELTVNSGLTSLNDGSGGLGGSIHLNDNLTISNQLEATLSTGSFGYKSGALAGSFHKGRWYFKTSGSVMVSTNDFEYVNLAVSNEPTERRKDEEIAAQTLSQSVSRSIGKKNTLSAHVLFSNLVRGVADPIISSEMEGKLKDKQARTLITWKRKGKINIEALAYLGEEVMSYDQQVFSEYTVQSRALNVSLNSKVKKSHLLNLSMENNGGSVISSGFSDRKRFSRLSAKLKYSYKKNKIKTELILREELFMQQVSLPMGVFTIGYKCNQHLELQSSLGRTFRFPSLNDLYWVQGGNLLLKPESGYSAESGVSIKFRGLKLGLVSYASLNRDLIVWQPSDGVFSPVNINKSRLLGSEINAEWSKKFNSEGNINISLKNAFNRAEEITDEGADLLPFRPLLNSVGTISLSNRHLTGIFRYSFMSERQGLTEFDQPLSPIHLIDIGVQTRMNPTKRITTQLELKINNLFSEVYEYVRWYPMPGRNLQINLSIKIK